MTDKPDCRSPMTNEKLTADCLLAAKVLQDTGSFETGQAILRDAAARIREQEAELASGSFYKEADIDALMARAEANAARLETALAQMQASLDRLTAERDAALVGAMTVTPLEWKRQGKTFIADHGAGYYIVCHDFDGWRWILVNGRRDMAGIAKHTFKDAEAAKAAAQADYDARILAALTIAPAPLPGVWYQGEPPKPWREEWFIAQTIHEDRVVLCASPEEYTYDYTTADHTYMIAGNIARWMQFPDSSFIAPAPSRDDVMEEREAYYFRAVLRRLREMSEAVGDALGDGEAVRMLGNEALHDEIGWLDCWLDAKQRAMKEIGK